MPLPPLLLNPNKPVTGSEKLNFALASASSFMAAYAIQNEDKHDCAIHDLSTGKCIAHFKHTHKYITKLVLTHMPALQVEVWKQLLSEEAKQGYAVI